MWAIGRALVVSLFGDDLVKYTLYAVAGIFAFLMLQGGSFFIVLAGQPWGLWHMGGTAQVAAPVQQTVAIPTLAPMPMAPTQPTSRIANLIASAMTWLGTRYHWGGCSHSGIDCSCFVQLVLRSVGVEAPRTTTTQVRWARPVSRAELQPGDLMFFNNTCSDCGSNPTHVAFYLGDNKQVHCGDPCQISNADWAHYASAGRIP